MAARSGQGARRQPARTSEGSPSPVYAICGGEAYLKAQAMRRVLDSLLKPDERSTALSEYEGSEASLADVLDDVRTLPFLAPRRVVIVRGADPFISRYRTHLEDYLDQPCPTGALILECKSLPKGTRLARRLESLGGYLVCEPVKGKALMDWVTNRCQTEYGKRIEYEAARHVVDLVGNSLGLLDGELEKLALYVGSRAVITRADTEALTGQHREQNVFGILAAMAAGDRASAMRQWEETLQSDRTAEFKAIGGVAYGVRQLIAAHEALRSGESTFAVSRRVFCDEAQLRARLRWFTPERLKRMLADLAEADLAAKSGARKVRTSIESFIVEHTAPQGRSSR